MSNEIVNRDQNLPQWMRSKSTGASLGNLDASDIKPPEVKLLQATSPECAEQPNARPGGVLADQPKHQSGARDRPGYTNYT